MVPNKYPQSCTRCKKWDYLYEDLCSNCLDIEDNIEAYRQSIGLEAKRWIPDVIYQNE